MPQSGMLSLIVVEWRIYASINMAIIDSDNGLTPNRRQAIIWTSAGILLIGPLGTNINEIQIKIKQFSYQKIHLKMSSAKCLPFCLGLSVIMETRSWHHSQVTEETKPQRVIIEARGTHYRAGVSNHRCDEWNVTGLTIILSGGKIGVLFSNIISNWM